MKFNEYARSREKQELISFLEEHGVDMEGLDLDQLVEAGWLANAKKGLVGRTARNLALAASIPAMMSANYKDQTPQPYQFQTDKLVANKQHDADEKADQAYIAAGGKKYEQTDTDAHEFVDFSKTPQHAEILKRAGLPRDYMPTNISNFVYGSRISTVSEISEEAGTIIQGEVKKVFGRDSYLRIVSSENVKTGGTQMLVEITGTVVATDKQDALRRAETIITQIVKKNGYEVEGFRDLTGDSTEVQPAPRSTMDYATEAAGQPIRFKLQVQILVRK